jgi:hypothetical protein
VAVVDLRDGREVGFFEFTAGCEEIYDVQVLPGVLRPMILSLEKPAARQAITNPNSCYWLRPSNEVREPAAPVQGVESFEGSASSASGQAGLVHTLET